MSAIIRVPNKRLSPTQVREMARKNWGLTKEQMCGMHVHHFPPRMEGGRDIPEHLYVCSPEVHKTMWHSDAWFMNNLMKAVEYNTGRKHSKETCEKKRQALLGRSFGHKWEGGEDHPNSKRVRVLGKEYVSQQEAADALNITIQGLAYRMKHWGPKRGYEYVK